MSKLNLQCFSRLYCLKSKINGDDDHSCNGSLQIYSSLTFAMVGFLRNLLVLVFVFSLHGVLAQEVYVDSLLRQLEHIESDSISAEINIELASYFLRKDVKKALDHSNVALDQSESVDDKALKIRALNQSGKVHWLQGNLDESANKYDQAITLAKEIDNKPLLLKSIGDKGILLASQAKYEEGILLFMEAKKGWESIQDSFEIAKISGNLGVAYRALGSSEEAIQHFQDGLTYFESKQDTTNICRITLNIAKLYRSLGNYETALTKASSLKPYVEPLDDYNIKSNVYTTLGLLHNHLGNYEEARLEFIRGLKLKEQLGGKSDLSTAYANVSYTYANLDSLNIAEKFAKKAYDLGIENNNRYNILGAGKALGSVYSKKGFSDEALAILLNVLTIAEQKNNPRETTVLYNYVSQAYSNQGDYQKAFYYQNEHKTLKDSLFNIDKISAVEAIEKQYNLEKYQKEILEKDANIARISNRAKFRIYLVGLFSVISLLFYILYLNTKKKRKIEKLSYALLNSTNNELKSKNEDLIDEINKMKSSENEELLLSKIITLPNKSKTRLTIGEIYLVKANDSMITIFTESESIHIWQRLKDFKNLLPTQFFESSHRSYIINKTKIKQIDKNEIVLQNNLKAKLSRGNMHLFS